MEVELTERIILQKSRVDFLSAVKNLNHWGQDIGDISILRSLPNVEVLALSVNKVRTLADVAHCRSLKELYLRKNLIADLREVRYLASLPALRVLWLLDNPCASSPYYRPYVLKVLPHLEKLDNVEVSPQERAEAASLPIEQLDAAIGGGGLLSDHDAPPSRPPAQPPATAQLPPSRPASAYDRPPSAHHPPSSPLGRPATPLDDAAPPPAVVPLEEMEAPLRGMVGAAHLLINELDERGLTYVLHVRRGQPQRAGHAASARRVHPAHRFASPSSEVPCPHHPGVPPPLCSSFVFLLHLRPLPSEPTRWA